MQTTHFMLPVVCFPVLGKVNKDIPFISQP